MVEGGHHLRKAPNPYLHTGGKWLIYGPKHRKDNQLQSLNIPAEYLSSDLNTI